MYVCRFDELGVFGDFRFDKRVEVSTVLMAATGIGDGTPWVQPARGERESLMLEAVQIALRPEVDINAKGTDGRTALDAANALRYESVVRLRSSDKVTCALICAKSSVVRLGCSAISSGPLTYPNESILKLGRVGTFTS